MRLCPCISNLPQRQQVPSQSLDVRISRQDAEVSFLGYQSSECFSECQNEWLVTTLNERRPESTIVIQKSRIEILLSII